MHPCIAGFQTILTPLAARLDVLDMILLVCALRRHPSPPGNTAFITYIVSPTPGTPPPAPSPMPHRVPAPPPAISLPAPPSLPPPAHSEKVTVSSAPSHPRRFEPFPHLPPKPPLRLYRA